MPSPHARICVHPANASPGVRGMRTIGMSDIVSTPPGRSTRNASAKNAARDGKWNAASTLITPSNDALRKGSRVASAFTPRAPASARRGLPASSWDSVMFTAVRLRVAATRAITGSCSARPLPTSSTSPPVGSSLAIVSTSRRTATGASAGSLPSPSQRPRLSHPGASAREKSSPRLS